MVYKRKRKVESDPRLEMTPMIDVVFLLLVFFVVTMKQEDILSRLTAARPEAGAIEFREKPLQLVTIMLYRDGFMFHDRPLTFLALDRQLARCSELNRNAGVVIKCTADSPHSALVRTLDLCSKHGMNNLSVFSL
jgi:biopolymer transport protein ExbD